MNYFLMELVTCSSTLCAGSYSFPHQLTLLREKATLFVTPLVNDKSGCGLVLSTICWETLVIVCKIQSTSRRWARKSVQSPDG